MPDRTEEARQTIASVEAGIERIKADQAKLDEEMAERRRHRAAQEGAEAGGETASRENPDDYLREPGSQESSTAANAEEEAQLEAARRWAAGEDDE